jgi:hypothetical protein
MFMTKGYHSYSLGQYLSCRIDDGGWDLEGGKNPRC